VIHCEPVPLPPCLVSISCVSGETCALPVYYTTGPVWLAVPRVPSGISFCHERYINTLWVSCALLVCAYAITGLAIALPFIPSPSGISYLSSVKRIYYYLYR